MVLIISERRSFADLVIFDTKNADTTGLIMTHLKKAGTRSSNEIKYLFSKSIVNNKAMGNTLKSY